MTKNESYKVEKTKGSSSSWLLYSIILSAGVLGFVIFKEVLFLIFGALAAALVLIFKK